MTLSNIDDIKRGLDARNVVEQYSHQAAKKMIRCPSQRHAQTGKTPPCSINYDSGLWKCHGCGASGSMIDFIGYCLYPDYNPRDHFKRVIDALAGEGIRSVPDTQRRQHVVEHPELPDFTLERCAEWTEKLARNQAVIDWLEGRGVTMWRNFHLGWTGEDKTLEHWQRNRITIPHLYRGRVWGIKLRRNPFSENGLKYISFSGSRFHVPYNADFMLAAQEHLILVETELDACAVQSVSGLPALAIPAGISEESAFAMLGGLIMCRLVTLIPDNDDAGRHWAGVLRSVIPRVRIHWLADFHKDIGEYIEDWKRIPNEITEST